MNAAVKIFNAISIIFIMIFIFWITQLNFEDLSFQENRNAYFGMFSVLLMTFAMQMIKRSLKKNNPKKDGEGK